jgi:transposase
MNESIHLVEYDAFGRMKYNPDYHFNQGTSWSAEDKKYLIEWLDKIGLEEMSLALGRTETTISEMARKLRKKGKMKPDTKARNPRLLKFELNINKPRKKRSTWNTKLSSKDIKEIIKLRESKKTLNEIAIMYNVSIYTIYTAIKRTTKDLAKVSNVAIRKNSTPLYHMEGGMQVG